MLTDRKSTRLNSSHVKISYAVFCGLHRDLPSFPTRRSSDLRLGLHGALARRVGPADIDAVDADAVEAVGVGGVAGQKRQRRLGGGIDGKVRRSAMGVDRQDVD